MKTFMRSSLRARHPVYGFRHDYRIALAALTHAKDVELSALVNELLRENLEVIEPAR